MGFKTEEMTNTSNYTFCNIIEGKFAIKATAETEGAVKRINKNEQQVFEVHHNAVEGFLHSVDTAEGKYGKYLSISLRDDNGIYVVQIPLDSSFAYSFFNRTNKINFDKEIELRSYAFEKGGKKTRSIVVYQFGQKLDKQWSEENRGELPDLKKIIYQGKEVWDSTDRVTYFEKLAETLKAKCMEANLKNNVANLEKPKLNEAIEDNDALESEVISQTTSNKKRKI